MDYLLSGMAAICGIGLAALWRLARSSNRLGDLHQLALKNQQAVAQIAAKIETLDSRQDKNFNEMGYAFVEMKCKVRRLEEKVLGESGPWKATLGSDIKA